MYITDPTKIAGGISLLMISLSGATGLCYAIAREKKMYRTQWIMDQLFRKFMFASVACIAIWSAAACIALALSGISTEK